MKEKKVPEKKPLARENFIDRAIWYFSPERGMNRMKARVARAMLGSYEGASKVKRTMQSWMTSFNDAD